MSEPTPQQVAIRGRRCTAHAQSGEQCRAVAMQGQMVCRVHGGTSMQAKAKAKLRLMELVDPAVATIARIMADPNQRAADRLRAAENILDRAGITRKSELDEDTARQILATKLAQILATSVLIEGEVEDNLGELG